MESGWAEDGELRVVAVSERRIASLRSRNCGHARRTMCRTFSICSKPAGAKCSSPRLRPYFEHARRVREDLFGHPKQPETLRRLTYPRLPLLDPDIDRSLKGASRNYRRDDKDAK